MKPLVVIGASAGGLEPLETFFNAAPLNAGWCFVVIQHLSPDYVSVMDQLLARCTGLQIRHIADGLALSADTIYLNRPSTLATIDGNVFRTQAYRDTDTRPHLPIDAMLTSIASREPSRTAAVILSGSGSDGSRGARKLHAAGGMVLAQSLKEASFRSMPQSTLNNDIADRMLNATDMPRALAEFFDSDPQAAPPRDTATNDQQSILKLLEDAHGLDFTDYKPHNVERRIQRRQQLQGYETAEAYRAALEQTPQALEDLYRDLLIGVTEFYRDEDCMHQLRAQVLDKLVQDPDNTTPLRIWVAGCSSGEEAYTIAIELSEAVEAAGSQRSFRVIATDVHRRSVDIASAGTFSAESVDKVPAHLRDRYFDKDRDRYTVTQALRQKLIFSVHDVLSDPPFMNLDLISCRNLMIYLTEKAQARVISMFLFGLKKDGCLLLGSSETLGRFSSEFRVLDSRLRIFQKTSDKRVIDRSILSNRLGMPLRPENVYRAPTGQRKADLARDASDPRNRDALIRSYDALLKRYAPSSILITDRGTVVAWFGAASAFVDTMNNLADWTVEEIVHPDLHFVINVAAEKLRQEQLEAYLRRITINMGDGCIRDCMVRIEPLPEVEGNRLMLVALELSETPDVATVPPANALTTPSDAHDDTRLLTKRITELERDLRLTEETLHHVTERLEASGEELQASNEELQASNEELQASNEELQSANEELHAVNEELVSVSGEHERQIETLSELNDNIETVLRTLDVGVIFVDTAGRVRRFSDIIAERFEFESHDVMRSLSVIGPHLKFMDLPSEVQTVLRTGQAHTAEGQHAGRKMWVKINPTLSMTNSITGDTHPDVSPSGTDTPGPTITGAVVIFRLSPLPQ